MKLTQQEINTHSYVIGANKLKRLCQNHFKHSPLNFFEPYKIYKNDDYCGLMSDDHWADYFLQKGYQHSGIAKFQEVHLKGEYTLWSFSEMFTIGECAKKMRQDCIDFNYGNGITFIERHSRYTQLYYFGARTEDKTSNEFFIENIALLRKFILYFEEQCRQDKYLFNAYNKKYTCRNEIEILPEHLNKKSSTSNNEFNLPLRRVYFQALAHEFYLTESELKCLILIIQGFTLKEIAKIFNLSPRTIETHLQHAKEKAGCSRLRELIQMTLPKLKNFIFTN
ncbi:MAG: LuxR family transcriptional regulator [Proteobacteria bacterium]|nr:LuxR family transcriptional regulator [Pseudomonadota bacterium]